MGGETVFLNAKFRAPVLFAAFLQHPDIGVNQVDGEGRSGATEGCSSWPSISLKSGESLQRLFRHPDIDDCGHLRRDDFVL